MQRRTVLLLTLPETPASIARRGDVNLPTFSRCRGMALKIDLSSRLDKTLPLPLLFLRRSCVGD